jgi:hypothetical protein
MVFSNPDVEPTSDGGFHGLPLSARAKFETAEEVVRAVMRAQAQGCGQLPPEERSCATHSAAQGGGATDTTQQSALPRHDHVASLSESHNFNTVRNAHIAGKDRGRGGQSVTKRERAAMPTTGTGTGTGGGRSAHSSSTGIDETEHLARAGEARRAAEEAQAHATECAFAMRRQQGQRKPNLAAEKSKKKAKQPHVPPQNGATSNTASSPDATQSNEETWYDSVVGGFSRWWSS